MSTGNPHASALEPPVRPSPPPQLLDFLRSGEPLSLLISGPPGAGKTTLALSLLANLGEPSYYIATRVGRGNLLHHFPWLVGSLPPERLVDLEDIRPSADRQEDLIHQLDHLVSAIDPLSAGRRLRDFLNLPEGLARHLGEPPARAGRRTLFLDSWDGLVEPYVHLLGLDELGRSTLEHGLLSLFQSAGCSLVLCTENLTPHSLEYLTDGVVELRFENLEGHIARYMVVRKLRGIALPTTTHAFTLHQGRFTFCPTIHPARAASAAYLGATVLPAGPSEVPRFGIPPLDEALGPLKAGDALLAELDPMGSSYPLAFVMVPFWTSVARAGWKAAFMMDLAHDPQSGKNLVSGGAVPGAEDRFRWLPSKAASTGEAIWEELLASVQPRTAVDVSVRSLGSYLRESGEALIARIGQLQRRVREQGALLVLVARGSDPILPALSTMVSSHLGVSHYHGTYLISGRSPRTPSIVVARETSGNDAPLHYLPMV